MGTEDIGPKIEACGLMHRELKPRSPLLVAPEKFYKYLSA